MKRLIEILNKATDTSLESSQIIKITILINTRFKVTIFVNIFISSERLRVNYEKP